MSIWNKIKMNLAQDIDVDQAITSKVSTGPIANKVWFVDRNFDSVADMGDKLYIWRQK